MEVPRCYHFARQGHRWTWACGQSEEDRPEKREGHNQAVFPLVSVFFFPGCELCQLLLSSGAASPPITHGHGGGGMGSPPPGDFERPPPLSHFERPPPLSPSRGGDARPPPLTLQNVTNLSWLKLAKFHYFFQKVLFFTVFKLIRIFSLKAPKTPFFRVKILKSAYSVKILSHTIPPLECVSRPSPLAQNLPPPPPLDPIFCPGVEH